MKNPNIKKPKLSENQIRGQIAAKQAELGALIKSHQQTVEEFNQRVGENQKRHNELTGGIQALDALLGGG